MTFYLFTLLAFSIGSALGQSTDARISSKRVLDVSIVKKQIELDSIGNSAAERCHSIQLPFDSMMSAANGRSKIIVRDTAHLQAFGASVDQLMLQLDSVERWRNGTVNVLNKEVEALKSNGGQKTKAFELRFELKGECGNLNALIENLESSLPETGIRFENQLSRSMPGWESPLSNVIGSTEDLGVAGLEEITGQAGGTMDQLAAKQLNANGASLLIENEAEKITEATGVSSELNEAWKVADFAGAMPDERAVTDELVTRAQQEAVDHFQGQEEQLREAIELVAKYKKKYGSFQSLEDIARRKGNPLRGTAFVERFIPGLAFQIHGRDAWMVDFNVFVSYRLYPRLTAGAGWNQRLAYDPDEYDFKPGLRIYGPRSFGEFQMGEGFSARLEAEYMNTRIPPQFSSRNADPSSREWVFTTMAGVKKEFRFFKDIKGTVMLLYNLHDSHHRSPYADRLTTRFGFEFPMKRKPEKVQE